MNTSTARRLVLMAFVGMVAMQTFREISVIHDLPRPSVYLSAAIAYSILGFMAELAPAFAVAMAFGLDLAILMQPGLLVDKNDPTKPGTVVVLVQNVGKLAGVN